MSNRTERFVQHTKLAQIPTPRLDALLEDFGQKTIKTLLQQVDAGLSEHDAQRLEDELVNAAQLWKRLNFLDAAARAACALVVLEHEALDVHMSPGARPVAPSQRAYLIARAILNDAHLMLDDAAPFKPARELTLLDMTRALVGLFCVRTGWPFEYICESTAQKLLRVSELTPISWRDRIARLAREYEKEKYPGKGSSST